MPLAPAAKRRLRRVRGLIAQELVEVTAVCHLPEPGKSTQPHMALTYLDVLDFADGLARYRACDTTSRMDTSLAANRVRLALREAGYQEWEGGRRGFIVEGDPQGGWVAVNYFPGFPTARRKRERELRKYRDLLSAAGFTVTPSPYTSGVLRVTVPAEPAGP
jgi:hypothetical protein